MDCSISSATLELLTDHPDHQSPYMDLLIDVKNPDLPTPFVCDSGDFSDASTVASSSQFYPLSSSSLPEDSDCSPTHSSIGSVELADEPTKIVGSYIIYLEPDPQSKFAQVLESSKAFLKGKYPGQDESFLYPLHITLTSFFDIKIPEGNIAYEYETLSSNISADDEWKRQAVFCDKPVMDYENGGNNTAGFLWSDLMSPALEPFPFLREFQDQPFSTDLRKLRGSTLYNSDSMASLVEERIVTAVQNFMNNHVSCESSYRSEQRLIELDSPAFEFSAERGKPMSISPGKVIIPWDLKWLVEGEIENDVVPEEGKKEMPTGMLHILCDGIEGLLGTGEVPSYATRMRGHDRGIRSENSSEGIPRKRKLHTTLLNRQDLSLQEHEDAFQYLEEALSRQEEETVGWNLCVKKLVSWGCSKRGKSHEFRDLLSVRNFAYSRRTK